MIGAAIFLLDITFVFVIRKDFKQNGFHIARIDTVSQLTGLMELCWKFFKYDFQINYAE